MLYYSLFVLLIALLAGILGFGVVAFAAAEANLRIIGSPKIPTFDPTCLHSRLAIRPPRALRGVYTEQR
jgi:hypothetical protein